MTAGMLLLILTLADAGQYSAAFVHTPTVAECERRAAAVRTILENGGTQIERIVCRASKASFEPFVHRTEPDSPRQRYLIRVNEEQVVVSPMTDGQACSAGKAGSDYCATSTQRLLANRP